MPVVRHSQAQVPAQHIREVADSLLLDLHSRRLFNGAVVLGRNGEELYARGFGLANAEAGVAFSPDTPADGGSVAKTLTAAALFMLREEGLLNLEDAVQEYIPEFPHAKTRVRHLITHTAGLPGYDFFDKLVQDDQLRTTSLFLRLLQEHRVEPAFEPGTRFTYDNLGFDVAALIVERLTGLTWEAYLRARVFNPLVMDSTFLRPARLAAWPGVRTLSYRPVGDSLVLFDIWDNEGFYGASNLYFSARDLDRWSQSFYTHPVLNTASLSIGTEAPVLEDPLTGEGGCSGLNMLSWYYSEQGGRFHYPGSLQGFWSYVYRDEVQRYSIVYISNNNMPQWLRPLLTRALSAIMEGRPARIDQPAFGEITGEDVGAMIGTYAVDTVGNVTIEQREDQVSIQIGSGIEYPAYFVGNGQLYVPGLDVWISFRDRPGRPFQHLSWLSVFRVAEGKRIDSGTER